MESKEDKLARQVEEVAKLAKQDKNIDAMAMVEMLMRQHEARYLPVKEKTRAFIFSIVVPPAALYYFFRLYGRDETDARQTAWVCLILGIVSIWLMWWFGSVFLNSSQQLQEIKNITPDQINQLTQ
ncbi:hypothetical protein D4R52_01975 [bacterium]|nr:MAG: hypothetical protein D4R52_01975 [bacterium]